MSNIANKHLPLNYEQEITMGDEKGIVTIEPENYNGKRIYRITYGERSFIVYKDASDWVSDVETRADWLKAIGRYIEQKIESTELPPSGD